MRRLIILLFFVLISAQVMAEDWTEKLGPELRKVSESDISTLSNLSEETINVFVEGDIDPSKYGDIDYEFKTFDGYMLNVKKSDIEILASDPNVELLEIGKSVSLFLQDSIIIINSTRVNNEIVLDENLNGKNQTICIIDTGINYNHADLGGGFGPGKKVVAGTDIYNGDSDPIDDNGHGTHVAGIAAANGSIKGVAPNASLVAVKALSASGGGTTTGIAQGIDWCANNAATYNITVISMSLGTNTLYSSYCDSTFPEFVAPLSSAVAKNITVIAASGNDGSVTQISSPGCMRNVTPIGSTTKSDAVSSFSNRNSLVSLLAPGSLINSTEGSSYAQESGTSMSTPHVAGAIALLKQKYRLLYTMLPNSTYPIDILNRTGKPVETFKRIDVYTASLMIDNVAPKYSLNQANTTLYHPGEHVLFSANWSDNTGVQYMNASLYTNESGAWKVHTTIPVDNSGFSNFTWINSSLRAGTRVMWSIVGNDSSNNLNATPNSTLVVYGWANVTDYNLSREKPRGNTILECMVQDANFTTLIENYTVSFYNSTSLLGTNTSNSSGVATYNWSTSALSIGNKSASCVIGDSTDTYYNASFHNFTSSFILKGVPVSNITNPIENATFFVGENVSFNSTTIQDNGSAISLTYASWYNTSSNISSTNVVSENYTWPIPINHSIGLQNITLNVTADNFTTSLKNITIAIYGYSEIHSNATSLTTTGSTSKVMCGVRNNNSLVSIANYNVSFYDNATLLGSNMTNSTGSSTLHHTFNSAGLHELSCTIANSAATYYNASNTTGIKWNVTVSSPPPSSSGDGGSSAPASESSGGGGGAGNFAPIEKRYAIAIATDDIEIYQGESKTVKSRITNHEDDINQISLSVSNIPASWYKISNFKTSMSKSESQDVEIMFSIPIDAKIGKHELDLIVKSNEISAKYPFVLNVKLSKTNEEIIPVLNKTIESLNEKLASISSASSKSDLQQKLLEAKIAISEGDIAGASEKLKEVDSSISQIQANLIKTSQKEQRLQIIYAFLGIVSILGVIILFNQKSLRKRFKV